MEFKERLRIARLQYCMTQKTLGDRIGFSTVTISNWESGIKQPSMDALKSLAIVLNVSADYLLGIDSSQESIAPISKDEALLLEDYRALDKQAKKIVRTVCSLEKKHIITTVQYITPQRLIPEYTAPSAAGFSMPLDSDDFEMIPVDDSVPSDADYAVKIQGDSMSPYIKDGQTVYVKRTHQIDAGDVGIFCVNGSMYCKLFCPADNGDTILVSANPDRSDLNIHISRDSNDSVVCYGKVILNFHIPLPNY